jgi:hypothetical protein
LRKLPTHSLKTRHKSNVNTAGNDELELECVENPFGPITLANKSSHNPLLRGFRPTHEDEFAVVWTMAISIP